ncbi:MAG: dihydroorotate dehydrogenase-like protein [Pirellulales bacterium]
MSVELTTQYLGLTLRNPIVVAPSPLTAHLYCLEQLEQAGAAAVVLSSLFEEQIREEADSLHGQELSVAESFAEPAAGIVRELDEGNAGVDSYLRRIELAKKTVSIPIIGSLNGTRRGAWTNCARLVQVAGADALELNVYYVPTDPKVTGAQVEQEYVDLVAEVRQQISIPLAVKIGPYFSSIPNMAARLVAAGADGLVIFNRFLQPDIDLQTLGVVPRLMLSSRDELRLPLRWIAILREQLSVSLAGTSGVHFAEDVLKMLLAGADVVMLASVLLRRGPSALEIVLTEVANWLEGMKYESLAQVRGLVCRGRSPGASAFERANYARALTSWATNTTS